MILSNINNDLLTVISDNKTLHAGVFSQIKNKNFFAL